ncbi:RNHCP domain-containing protein [Candidatus Kaiserbacteria bacterium]|nr:MAG: RNHCP domain-containing protein [Candidatus Kaiserbacteria bacterium]
MSRTFQRKKENFVCDNCGANVVGSGYTNHCPECLWSKHVDVYPGDRAAQCGGLMKPIEVLREGDSYILLHKCIHCQYVKKNKLAREDNMETVIALAQEIANK